jgi:hypothetical protein
MDLHFNNFSAEIEKISFDDFKWDGMDQLLSSAPVDHGANTRVSVFDRFDLDKIEDSQLFNISDRFSLYVPKMSPPKGNFSNKEQKSRNWRKF